MTSTYLDWQFEQRECPCTVHRYHVAHLCSCGKIISHSQGDWEQHKFHDMLDFDSDWYKHGDTIADVLDRYIGYGMHMPWIENENTRKAYMELCDKFGN